MDFIVLQAPGFSSIVVEAGPASVPGFVLVANPSLGTALTRSRFLAPGDKLGKHDLIRQIAVGGMAELYLARTMGIEGFEKLAVVKRILPQYASNASFVNMFLNEARLAATFHHPNIAQVYDIGQEAGDYFFSMEYVHGEDLGRLVASSNEGGVPISLDAALTLAAGLCAGLHHAHEKASPEGKPLNVVHRDVSPSNVLVSYDGAVKVVDFGIARVNTTPGSTAGGLKGKISYMSPEQCRGKVTLDRRSDIFSIGTILYELTTGQLPFHDETEYAILNMIVNTDAVPPSTLVPGYPAALEAIVMRALARDPDRRYSTALELQGQLEDFAHENRLRVSPLVLARLMSTLFPARLEEWDHARAQGAFFVEQHVVRTLIESGKTGESAAVQSSGDASHSSIVPAPARQGAHPDDDDRTAVTAPPIAADDDQPTSVRTPVNGSPVASERAKTPIPVTGAPQPHVPARASTPRMPTPVVPVAPGGYPLYVPLPAPQPGTLVSNRVVDPSQVPHHVGDVTERVRIPTTPSPSARRGNKPSLLLVLALCGAASATAVTYLVLSAGSPDKREAAESPATKPESASPPVAEPTTAKPTNEIVAPATAPAIEAEPVKPPPKVAPAKPRPEPTKAIKAEPVKPKPEPPKTAIKAEPEPAKPRPKLQVKPKPKAKLAKPDARPQPKESQWSGDSPFLPVRPDKK
jgi:serine/threonine-protein kinase